MAAVLQIEPDRLRAALDRASGGQVGCDLAGCRGTGEASWETAFEFPVDSVADAEVEFDLRCKEPGRFARSLGTYRTKGASLGGSTNCTQWRTIKVPGTEATLKLKLGMRSVGSVAAAVHLERSSTSTLVAN